MEDAQVVERVLAGETDAFEHLVSAHSRAIYALAFRVIGERTAAEDAVQETFLRAYRFLPRFDQRAKFSTWLHKIAVNAAIDQTRRGRAERSLRSELPEEGPGALHEQPSAEAAPDRLATSSELARRTREALAGLTATERTAFLLRHYEGRSIAEISSTLGKRENATKQSIFRAVRKLREALGPWKESVHEAV